jgi:hypothetical protein
MCECMVEVKKEERGQEGELAEYVCNAVRCDACVQ